MSNTYTDEELLKLFKNIAEINKAQGELNILVNKRLKILEASQFRQPLVLTKEMEVKN
jgi:plasmid maintenance system killer protein